MTISPAQIIAMKRIVNWSVGGRYMPYATEQKTFDALEQKGFVEYHQLTVEKHAGYTLTELGKASIK